MCPVICLELILLCAVILQFLIIKEKQKSHLGHRQYKTLILYMQETVKTRLFKKFHPAVMINAHAEAVKNLSTVVLIINW